jgi:hypothetical protein
MKQAREYGQYLRVKYDSFLNSLYNRSNVLARSTDYDRTLQSSYALLSGLFPPGNTYQRFDQILDWQPIPVHTTSKASDTVRRLNKNSLSNNQNFFSSYSQHQIVLSTKNYRMINLIQQLMLVLKRNTR